MATLITSDHPKGQQYLALCRAAYNKAGLDNERAQRVNEHGGELQEGLIKLLQELSLPAQYADEEHESSFTYPPEYAGPKPITDQIGFLAETFDLDPTGALEFAKNLPALSDDAEGWFAIPSVDALAKKHFPTVADSTERYCRSVQLVLDKLGESRAFINCRKGQITPAQLRLSDRTVLALNLVAEVQKSGILIVAAQLGLRHRGRSVRRAREVFVRGEFGLGSLAVVSITLVHPRRLVRWEQLHMDCPGDEFTGADDEPVSPFLDYDGVEVGFGAHWVGYPSAYYGSASAFLPECPDA